VLCTLWLLCRRDCAGHGRPHPAACCACCARCAAEIVLGTVTNLREALQWLTYTYLSVRMTRNPLAYGLTMEDTAVGAAAPPSRTHSTSTHPCGALSCATPTRLPAHPPTSPQMHRPPVPLPVQIDPSLEAHRRKLLTVAAGTLKECKMAVYDDRSGNFYVTELGRVASHYYIRQGVGLPLPLGRALTMVDRALRLLPQAPWAVH